MMRVDGNMSMPACYDLLPLIYSTAVADELWPEVLDRLVATSNAAGAFVRAFDRIMLPYSVNHASAVYMKFHHLFGYYVENFQKYDEEALHFMSMQPAGRLILDSDIWGPIEALQHRADFVWLKETGGLFRRVGLRLNASPAWWDSLFFQFDQSLPVIPEESLATISLLVPHLAKALEMGRTFRILQSRFRVALAALNRVKVGVAVLLANGHVLIANLEAQRLFDAGDALRLDRDGIVRARTGELGAQLLRHVARLAHTSRGKDSVAEEAMTLERGPGRDPLLIELSPLQDSRHELGRDVSGVMLTMIDPRNRPAISTDNIAQLYGLSPAEMEVCEHLINGMTQNDIAELRNVSQDTIKKQIQNIYRKTQTERRVDLIRLAVEVNPPIERSAER